MGYNVVIVNAENKEHVGHCDGMYSRFGDAAHLLNKLKVRHPKTKFDIVSVELWDKNNKLISDIRGELT